MRTIYPFLLVGLAALTTLNSQLMGENPPPPSEVPQLQLSGTARLERPADQVTIVLGVVTTADKAGDAIKDNAVKMEKSVNALTKAGLTKEEYQTSSFEIDPVYTPRPRNPPADWKQEIVGYRVSNLLVVKTSRIDDVGQLIDAATSAGTNSINRIQFGLKDHRAYRDKAIAEATSNAMADAKIMANAANITLGRILSMSLGGGGGDVQYLGMQRSFAADEAFGGSGASTSIKAGDVTIEATVHIVYEIQEPGKS